MGLTVLVIALLAATIAAFALAERLKLEPSPVTDTRVPIRAFSPVCDCERETVPIGFDLRNAGRVIVVMVDRDERAVRRLVDRDYGAGPVRLRWDGRDDAGDVVPEGSYTPRIRLPDEQRLIEMPNPIRVDTTPPRVLEATVTPLRFSPDGDRRLEKVTVTYRLDEPARGLLYVNGELHERTLFRPLEDERIWRGRRGGRPLPAGDYELEVAAEDIAGNVGERTAPTTGPDPLRRARQGHPPRSRRHPLRRPRPHRRALGALAFRGRDRNRAARRARPACTASPRPLPALRRGERPRGPRGRRRHHALVPPPVLVLGVRRSGTTLLRVMLDRNPELAVPDESYFVPTLARRHGERPDLDAFEDDIRRLPTIVEWELDPAGSARGCSPARRSARPFAAVYEAYAAGAGRPGGATRRRCTCSTCRCSSGSSRTRASST